MWPPHVAPGVDPGRMDIARGIPRWEQYFPLSVEFHEVRGLGGGLLCPLIFGAKPTWPI